MDEFQDTSLFAIQDFEPLIKKSFQEIQQNLKHFFYVGDTKQSIYRFRWWEKRTFDYVANSNKLLEVEVF